MQFPRDLLIFERYAEISFVFTDFEFSYNVELFTYLIYASLFEFQNSIPLIYFYKLLYYSLYNFLKCIYK